MKPVRVGSVKYLNARPLIRGWLGNVEFDHPSALCQRLAKGELDVALVSSFEFLRNPIYRIVDDVSIASDGPVYSVVVAHRGELSDVEEIELDPASETSVNLLRCLLAELGLNPRLTRNANFQTVDSLGLQPAECFATQEAEETRRNIDFQSVRPAALQPAESLAGQPGEAQTAESISAGRTGKMPMFQESPRARLIIGDQAISFRQKHANQFRFWDLGEQWKKLTGLPFVYALWLIRRGVPDTQSIAQRLRTLRDKSVADLPAIMSDAVAGVADNKRAVMREFLDRYYHQHLRFGFGAREKQGLQTFADLCAKHGLLPKRSRDFTVV